MDLFQATEEKLRYLLPSSRIGVMGESTLGRHIYFATVGSGRPHLVCVYATHAREWITSLLATEHLAYLLQMQFRGRVTLVPMHNPDGVMLATKGLCSVEDAALRQSLTEINGGSDFSLWKANARGIDLNVNFPARWGQGKGNRYAPHAHGYIGKAPLCAAENALLASFLLRTAPDGLISYHAKGEVIYWQFYQQGRQKRRDLRFARALSSACGYPLASPGNSTGGLKDWCVSTLKIPAVTVEVGADSLAHPIGANALPQIFRKTKELALSGLRLL